ncbi:formyltransferase family protein [Anabaena cylindrica UHCC 0172]|uniref:formyltransferase family protein n=1 Tax=Anabaena cylindrica TaxID=1165 RepID=UPI002B1FB3C5|nr:formyltransferase family protein [Anabaena cylindrica]MEA5550020.1 formyltransferase family protein [Anabaena cylindrica UHCC 0172]
MLNKEFYLVTDSSIACCYLVSKWIDNFSGLQNFKGILVKEEIPSDQIQQEKKSFHKKYAGQKNITDEIQKKILELYPDFDDTEKAMIAMYGIPKYSTIEYAKTIFIGSDINGEYARNWLIETCKYSVPLFFTSVCQILKPWWIEIAKSQVLNVHSAVLPYARGMYAIENFAALKDIHKFRKAAGSTIHYIDAGVDTGPIIMVERIVNPFRFNSIWELKGYTYMNGFDLYIKTAKHILTSKETILVGVVHDPKLRGPNFYRKDFTLEKCRQAEEGYLSMKNS